MLIDRFTPDWLDVLDSFATAKQGENTYLLIDGAFVPGIYKRISQVQPKDGQPVLLFESLPGCDQEVLDYSPFVILYDRANTMLKKALDECSGWPMISAVSTTESLLALAQRLAVWCVIDAAGQYINLRFPDTRRLPDIYAVLTVEQRISMFGPGAHITYIGRDGKWNYVTLAEGTPSSSTPPRLTTAQFDALVACSQGDSVLTQLESRGFKARASFRSPQYQLICAAIGLAKSVQLQHEDLLVWCRFSLESTVSVAALPELLRLWESSRRPGQVA